MEAFQGYKSIERLIFEIRVPVVASSHQSAQDASVHTDCIHPTSNALNATKALIGEVRVVVFRRFPVRLGCGTPLSIHIDPLRMYPAIGGFNCEVRMRHHDFIERGDTSGCDTG